jgi:EmrB/QacA subfamily drug resistance transporter
MTAHETEIKSTPRSTAPPLDKAVIVTGLVVICGAIMAILDTTVVNVALDNLSQDLHAPLSVTQWVVTGYLLALGLVVPLSGWASARLGTKTTWIASLALFTAGSALSGLAWSMGALIAFRIVQGLGGGMIMPVAQTILARAAGPDRIGRAMAILGVPMLLGPVFGPVLGGLLVQEASWHWIFYINVPIGLLAIALAWWKLPRGREDAGRGTLDLPGLGLLAASFVLLLYGLSRAATAGGFTAFGVLAWLISGGACLLAFVGYSLARRDRAVLNVRLFRDPTFAASSAAIFIIAVALLGGMLLLPLYYQVVRVQSPLSAGLLLAPQGLGAMLMMPLAGRITDKYGPGFVIPAGIALLLLGTLPFTTVHADTPAGLLIGALVVRGLGIGASMMPVIAAAYRRLSPEHVPQAAMTTSALIQIGGSFGAAVVAMELTRRIAHNFTALGISLSGTATSHIASQTPAVLYYMAPWIADAFGYTFWFLLVPTAVALLPAALLLRQAAGERAVLRAAAPAPAPGPPAGLGHHGPGAEEGADVGDLLVTDAVAEARVDALGQRRVAGQPAARPVERVRGDHGVPRSPPPEHGRPLGGQPLVGRLRRGLNPAGQHDRGREPLGPGPQQLGRHEAAHREADGDHPGVRREVSVDPLPGGVGGPGRVPVAERGHPEPRVPAGGHR